MSARIESKCSTVALVDIFIDIDPIPHELISCLHLYSHHFNWIALGFEFNPFHAKILHYSFGMKFPFQPFAIQSFVSLTYPLRVQHSKYIIKFNLNILFSFSSIPCSWYNWMLPISFLNEMGITTSKMTCEIFSSTSKCGAARCQA